MSLAMEPGLVLPRPQPARIFGILNLVFGWLLANSAYSMLLYLAIIEPSAAAMGLYQQFLSRQMQTQHASRVATLEKQRDAAQDEESRAALEGQIAAAKARPVPKMPSMTAGIDQIREPTIFAYSLISTAVSLVMGLALIVAGVGLLRLRDGGRKATIGLSVAYLASLLIGLVFTVGYMVPIQTRLATRQMESAMKASGNGAAMPFQPQQFGQFTAVTAAGSAVMSSLVAGAYPVLAIWFLTRPGVRVACLARTPGKGPGAEAFL